MHYFDSQITFDTNQATNSFAIERNQSPELECTSSTLSPNPSSCYTGGVLHLVPNDMIYVKDSHLHRSTIKDPNKSFFGIIKVA